MSLCLLLALLLLVVVCLRKLRPSVERCDDTYSDVAIQNAVSLQLLTEENNRLVKDCLDSYEKNKSLYSQNQGIYSQMDELKRQNNGQLKADLEHERGRKEEFKQQLAGSLAHVADLEEQLSLFETRAFTEKAPTLPVNQKISSLEAIIAKLKYEKADLQRQLKSSEEVVQELLDRPDN